MLPLLPVSLCNPPSPITAPRHRRLTSFLRPWTGGRVRIFRSPETPSWALKVAQHVLEDVRREVDTHLAVGSALVYLRICEPRRSRIREQGEVDRRREQLGLVVQHLLEVRDYPSRRISPTPFYEVSLWTIQRRKLTSRPHCTCSDSACHSMISRPGTRTSRRRLLPNPGSRPPIFPATCAHPSSSPPPSRPPPPQLRS